MSPDGEPPVLRADEVSVVLGHTKVINRRPTARCGDRVHSDIFRVVSQQAMPSSEFECSQPTTINHPRRVFGGGLYRVITDAKIPDLACETVCFFDDFGFDRT